jgi:hypothetical protein
MAWIRIDDGFADHPKLLKAGPLAVALQIRALCYSARHLTDGFIPAEMVPVLTLGFPKKNIKWQDKMLESGIWEIAPNGYRIHDYLKYNSSKKEVLKALKDKRLAGRRGGLAKAKQKSSRLLGVCQGNILPRSHPIPSHIKKQDQTPSGVAQTAPRPSKSPKKANPSIKVVIDTYYQEFRERFGTPPPINGAKAGAVAKKLLVGRSEQDATWIIKEFFSDTPEWYEERHLYGLEHILSAATQILTSPERRKPKGLDPALKAIIAPTEETS